METKKFKQATYDGCLPSCLLILENGETSPKEEIELILASLLKRRDNYYAYNVLSAFTDKYRTGATLYVGIKPYAKYLDQHKDTQRIKIIPQQINKEFLSTLAVPYVVYLDDYVLGEETHAQHFVVIEEFGETETRIINPWHGSRTTVATSTLIKAIESLKTQFLYSPLAISVDYSQQGSL